MKHLRLEIDNDLHKDLKVYAISKGKTMPTVIIQALRRFLEEKKGQEE